MSLVRELLPGETHLAAAAMLELRPQWGDADAITARMDAQRETGYRLVASFADEEIDAAAVGGFRLGENLHLGRHLYVDDLVTRAAARGRGHADAVLAWIEGEARRAGCAVLHLDSGVGPERANAHRFYFRHGMRIASYHFSRALD